MANLFVEETSVKDCVCVVLMKFDDLIKVLSLLELLMELQTSAVENLHSKNKKLTTMFHLLSFFSQSI